MKAENTREKRAEGIGKKIDERTLDFALMVIELCSFLQRSGEYVMSKQLLRSGTSIGANTQEAQAASSRKDFVAKMTLASKEARETAYWLTLLDRSGYLDGFSKRVEILREVTSVMNIVTKIVKTSRSRVETE